MGKELRTFKPRKDTEAFISNFPQVKTIYQEAFSGFPWYSNVSDKEATDRIKSQIEKDGFTAYVIEDKDQIVGALWYDTPSIDELTTEKGEVLGTFSEQKMDQEDLEQLIFIRETMVHPNYQGRKIASSLREAFFKDVTSEEQDGTLILTRHRDDNQGIIRLSELWGFQRTGIRMPSSSNPNADHEYWYKVVPPKNFGDE